MHLLELKDIGKIYTTEEAVSVGIRGVNLSFDLGEFVAITGQSGSGKTTLLNVIGGMDSFEEGELYVEGKPTSHYTKEEWDLYRKQWISFVLQDYGIIESFTALENVELALLTITNRKERRSKALELLDRVGLSDQAHQKAGELSGGQKQRTVIARALAQNRPVILADEPTGNLDSESACEVMHLLHELSEDKLVLVVTHNFAEVAAYATREIRVFDGAVREERRLTKAQGGTTDETSQEKAHNLSKEEVQKTERVEERKSEAKHFPRGILEGIGLGWRIFRSRLGVSFFVCLLMVVTTLGLFLFTAALGMVLHSQQSEDAYIFRPIEGRAIVVRKDGAVITKEELQALGEKYGASQVIFDDVLCDLGETYAWEKYVREVEWLISDVNDPPFAITYEQEPCEPSIGRYPQTPSECLLYLPYSLQDCYGRDTILVDSMHQNGATYDIVGIKYYADNHQIGQMVLTEEGYRINTALASAGTSLAGRVMQVLHDGSTVSGGELCPVRYSFDLEPGKFYVLPEGVTAVEKELLKGYCVDLVISEIPLDWSGEIYKGVSDFLNVPMEMTCEYEMETSFSAMIVTNPYTLLEAMENHATRNNTQSSLVFESNKAMKKATEQMGETEYLVLPSDSRYVGEENGFIEQTEKAVAIAVLWMAVVAFFGLVVYVSMRGVMDTFAKEAAIMRSIGVEPEVIHIGVYTRMLLSTVPAVAVLFASSYVLYRTTIGNRMLLYLYPVHYVLLFAGMLALALIVANRQLKRIYAMAAKQALGGGNR